jgi:hypothetical protein
MFMRYPPYQVLICCEHRCAVYGLDKHLERHHAMPAAARRALLAEYEDFDLLPPAEVGLPLPYSYPITELGPAQDAFLCCCSTGSVSGDGDSAVCSYISTSRVKMRQHINQQHSVKLTRWSSPATASYKEHAEQLWQPVKVQTFFRERRYVRYYPRAPIAPRAGCNFDVSDRMYAYRQHISSCSLRAIKLQGLGAIIPRGLISPQFDHVFRIATLHHLCDLQPNCMCR